MTTITVGAETTYINHRTYPTPAGGCTDPMFLAALIDEWAGWAPAGTSVVIPMNTADPFLVAALAARAWELHTHGRAWSTYRNASTWMHIGRANHTNDPMITGAAGSVHHRMMTWETHAGAPYHSSPGTAAIASMTLDRATRGARGNMHWRLQDPRTAEWWKPPAEIGALALNVDRGWSDDHEVHHWYDRRAAYLASAAAVDLPYRKLHPTGPDVDPYTTVGYYKITRPLTRDGWPLRGHGADVFWECHPMVQFMKEFGAVEILDSYTSQRYGRILRPWCESWRDFRAYAESDLPELLPTIKAGYAEAFGLFNVPRGTVYRPDIRHMIMSESDVNTLRRVFKIYDATGLMPCKINTDALYYPTQIGTSDMGLGDNIGNMVYKGQSS